MAVARAARMTALQPAGSVHPMPSIRILKPVDGEILRDSPTQVRPSAGAAQRRCGPAPVRPSPARGPAACLFIARSSIAECTRQQQMGSAVGCEQYRSAT
jgi:hypothetical protein